MQPEQPQQQPQQYQPVNEPQPAALTTPTPGAQPPQPPVSTQQGANEPNGAGWSFTGGPTGQPASDNESALPLHELHNVDISWSASEFVEHYKSPVWYLGLAGVTIVTAAVAYLLTKDLITTAMICVIGLAFGIVAGRPPRTMRYHMTQDGIYVQEKFMSYLEFKSFSVIDEGAVSVITLVPLKRFMPLTYIYYPPEQEEPILAILSEQLPYEERRNDPIDTFMHRLRF